MTPSELRTRNRLLRKKYGSNGSPRLTPKEQALLTSLIEKEPTSI